MGLRCRSPDSWCRRFNVDNASLKSERFLNGPVFPDLLRKIHQFCLYRKSSDFCHVVREILVRKSVNFDTNFFISIMFELGCTEVRIVQKAIVDPLKTPLEESLFQIMGLMIISLLWSFSISVAMRSCLLNHVVRKLREGPMFLEWRLGWLHFLSRVARMCNRRCLRSNMIGILCTASQGLSRTIQTALHCPCPESFSWTSQWTGCRLCFCCRSRWRDCRWGWFSIFLKSFTNTRAFSLFHNWMWQCGYPEVDVNLV